MGIESGWQLECDDGCGEVVFTDDLDVLRKEGWAGRNDDEPANLAVAEYVFCPICEAERGSA